MKIHFKGIGVHYSTLVDFQYYLFLLRLYALLLVSVFCRAISMQIFTPLKRFLVTGSGCDSPFASFFTKIVQIPENKIFIWNDFNVVKQLFKIFNNKFDLARVLHRDTNYDDKKMAGKTQLKKKIFNQAKSNKNAFKASISCHGNQFRKCCQDFNTVFNLSNKVRIFSHQLILIPSCLLESVSLRGTIFVGSLLSNKSEPPCKGCWRVGKFSIFLGTTKQWI